MGSYIPPSHHDNLVRAVLRSVVADHYARDNDPNGDAEAEHATEQVAIYARGLTHAVDKMAPDSQPVGWAAWPAAKVEPHTVIVTRGQARGEDNPLDTPGSYYVPWTGLQYTIKHPAMCNALPYCERCWFDRATVGQIDQWPTEPGMYEVSHGSYVPTGDGLTRQMQFERTGDAPAATHYGASPFHAGTTTHVGERSNCPAPDCMDTEYEAVHEEATAGILNEVAAERARQIEKWGEQHHPDGTGGQRWRDACNYVRDQTDNDRADGQDNWLNILREETFEAFAEDEHAKLRAELVQAAAVAVAWIEDIDSRATPTKIEG